MAVQSNIVELIEKFKKISEAGEIDFSAALTLGVNAAKGAMDFRIFNKGLDANGEAFGKYSGKKYKVSARRGNLGKDEPGDAYVSAQIKRQKKKLAVNAKETGQSAFTEYEKKRLTDGRQIAYKDLEFHGSLRRSIITASEGRIKVVCFFNNNRQAVIAEGQEKQIGKIKGQGRVKIFALSKEERELMQTNINAGLKQLYDRLFSH